MNNKRYIWGGACFLTAFFYCMIFIWQGLDVTDDGFQLTHQYMVISNGLEYGFPPVWLSEVVGGLWLHLTDGLGLIGARIGWSLGIALTALAAYIFLSSLFSPRDAALSVLLTVPLSAFTGQMVFNYYYFPALLLVMLTATLFFSFRHASNKKKALIYAVISGALLTLSFSARGSLITVFVLPLFIWFCFRVTGSENKYASRMLILMYAVSILILVAVGGYIYISGHWEQYYQAVTQVSSKRGQAFSAVLTRQLGITLKESMKILMLVIAGGGVYLVAAKRSRYYGWAVLFGVLIAVIYIIITARYYWMAMYGAIYVFAVLSFCLVWISVPDINHKRSEILILLVVSALLPVLITFGASSVMLKMYYGYWLLVPLVLLSIITLETTSSSRFGAAFFRQNLQLREFAFTLVCAVSMVAIYQRMDNPYYRDSSERTRLTAAIDYPRLQGIHTTPERAQSFGDLVKAVDSFTEPGDKILVYNSVPLLYFITKTVPFFKRNWLIIANTTPEAVQVLADNLCKDNDINKKSIPRIIVRALINTRDPEWGLIETKPVLEQFIPLLDILDKGVQKCKPEVIWSNHDFVIYRPML